MEEKNYTGIIPNHETGKIIDSVRSVELNTEEEAKAFFSLAKERLQNVNQWHEIAGVGSAHFQLINAEGKQANRLVHQGDFFKIDVPGPGSVAGDGFDWVRVEEVKEVSEGEIESLGIRVRPASNPMSQDDSIAHFYSEGSTSNFTVSRERNKITVGIYDRNTKPNEDTSSVIDKARDFTVGLGAVTAFSAFQWDKLAEGILRSTEIGG
ncbi:hypothetical protein [Pedobacter sp. SYSU D00535]|uniref:hypothetical protein n=1 Tax=Pedobacter sp. SYSU D00535 TaxID=2810308 RepID=UPI001A969A74|nr:hypothetical protein [Pedobacter sp. SYSU D00535]